jgi:hypothetical protein
VAAAAAESKEVALASVSMAPARVSMVASGGAQGAALGTLRRTSRCGRVEGWFWQKHDYLC